MRSNIFKQVLDETPPEVCDFVRTYANSILTSKQMKEKILAIVEKEFTQMITLQNEGDTMMANIAKELDTIDFTANEKVQYEAGRQSMLNNIIAMLNKQIESNVSYANTLQFNEYEERQQLTDRNSYIKANLLPELQKKLTPNA
jgi:hypothetical protein